MPLNAEFFEKKILNIDSSDKKQIIDVLDDIANQITSDEDIDTVRKILVSLTEKNKELQDLSILSTLQLAVLHGSLKLVKRILELEPDKKSAINLYESGINAFGLAIKFGNSDIVELFLKHGAYIHGMLQDEDFLSIAKENNDLKTILLLLRNGIDTTGKWNNQIIDFAEQMIPMAGLDFQNANTFLQAPAYYEYFFPANEIVRKNRQDAFLLAPALFLELENHFGEISLPEHLQQKIDKGDKPTLDYYQRNYNYKVSKTLLSRLPPPYHKLVTTNLVLQLIKEKALSVDYLPKLQSNQNPELEFEISQNKNLREERISFCNVIAFCEQLAIILTKNSNSMEFEQVRNNLVAQTANLIKGGSWKKIEENLQKSVNEFAADKYTYEQKFQKYFKSIRACVVDYARNLILPEVVKKLYLTKQFDIRETEWILNDAIDRLLPQIVNILFQQLPLTKIFELHDKWHREGTQAMLRRIRGKDTAEEMLEWDSVIPNKIIEVPKNINGESGWVIVNLASARDMYDEANRMHSCLGSFAKEAYLKPTYFFSIRNPNDVSERTLNFELYKGKFVLLRSRGSQAEEARPPSEKVAAIIAWFGKQMDSKNILGVPVDCELLEQKRYERMAKDRSVTNVVSNLLQYNCEDQDKVVIIQNAYKEALPMDNKAKKNFDQLKNAAPELCEKLINKIPAETLFTSKFLILIEKILDSKFWNKSPSIFNKMKEVLNNNDWSATKQLECLKEIAANEKKSIVSIFKPAEDRMTDKFFGIMKNLKFDEHSSHSLEQFCEEVNIQKAFLPFQSV